MNLRFYCMNGKINYKVSVRCMTYNQSQYIQDTLNGFCMQKTNFHYVCTIVDDASTDGEQEIIKGYFENNFDVNDKNVSYHELRDYGSVYFARHLENRNCYFALLFLKRNHYQYGMSKLPYLKEWIDDVPYLAICEGDDYWCDPLKLQKQYDLMELHPEYSLCHHDYKILEESELKNRLVEIPHTQNLPSLAEFNNVASLTMFFRNYNESWIPEGFPFKYPVYQHFLNLRLAEHGDVIYINEPMAVYRVNQGGINSMKPPRVKFTMAMGNLENMIDWYTEGYPRPDVVAALKTRAKIIWKNFIKQSIKHCQFGDALFMWKWFKKLQNK